MVVAKSKPMDLTYLLLAQVQDPLQTIRVLTTVLRTRGALRHGRRGCCFQLCADICAAVLRLLCCALQRFSSYTALEPG